MKTSITSCILAISLLAAISVQAQTAKDINPADHQLPKSVFLPAKTINGWIETNDLTAMSGHAWDLFVALMKRTNISNGTDKDDKLRVYDTWWSIDEVLPELPAPPAAPLAGVNSALMSPRAQAAQYSRMISEGGVKSRAANTPVPRLLHMLKRPEQVDRNVKQPQAKSSRPILESLVSDVKYSDEIRAYVGANLIEWEKKPDGKPGVAWEDPGKGYTMAKQLGDKRQAHEPDLKTWETPDKGTPFAMQNAVMLKPAYTVVSGQHPTIVAYWSEKREVANGVPADGTESAGLKRWVAPTNADAVVAHERSWLNEVLVVPEHLDLSKVPDVVGRNGAVLDKISVRDFHHFKLDAAQAKALNDGIFGELLKPRIAQAGDFALLTAMHVATREIEDWTWQTFWWTHDADPCNNGTTIPLAVFAKLDAEDQRVLGKFRLSIGYSFIAGVSADSKNPAIDVKRSIICSNPYLEGPFGSPDRGGVDRFESTNGIATLGNKGIGMQSNCVTCHRAAAYPAWVKKKPGDNEPLLNYTDYGFLSGAEAALFKDRLKTLYIWGIANKTTDYNEPPAGP